MVDVNGTWVPAVWTAFKASALTRSGRDVLLTLCTFRGRRGQIYPSHASLARRVGCCVRTVRSALRDAREAGLVTWQSGRRRRTSNRYSLELPRQTGTARVPRRVERLAARAACALVGNRRPGGEHRDQRGSPRMTSWVPTCSPRERMEAQATLAAIQSRRAAERDAAWHAERLARARAIAGPRRELRA